MATSAPWSAKTTKRRRDTKTLDSHRRRRASLPAEDEMTPRARQRKQKTLTQLQWVTSPPLSIDEGELRSLEVETEPRSRSRQRVPTPKESDSTLTQMGFLAGRPSFEMVAQDLVPSFAPRQQATPLPQLDGTCDSPRKPRTSRNPGGRVGSQRKRKSVSLPADESQDYVPTTKRRKGKAQADETLDLGQRRRSRRHADKVISDPAENFTIFQEGLADVMPSFSEPRLEIKDSTSLDEDFENVIQPQEIVCPEAIARPKSEHQISVDDINKHGDVSTTFPRQTIPSTPQKGRQYIPSSQSPESLPPSVKKNDITSPSTPKVTLKRTPLADLLANKTTRPPLTDFDDVRLDESISKKPISMRKLPNVPLGSIEKYEGDDQANTWAVQPKSSLKLKGYSPRIFRDMVPGTKIEEEQAKNPSRQFRNTGAVPSSPPEPAETGRQKKLSHQDAILKREPLDSNDNKTQHASAKSDIETKDFATHPQQTPQRQTQHARILQTQAGYVGEANDFGSPIANDTQFAADLARIPASPLQTSDSREHFHPHNIMCISSSSSSEGDASTLTIRAPELVDRVDYQNASTVVPAQALSSPILPPMAPPMQKSVAPAPLPHPSQMSTQEPSQQLPQLSSVPERSPTRTDRISIKDSSSVHEHMSQLPEFNADELQLQRELESTRRNVLEDEDDDDDGANDDLDSKTPPKILRPEQRIQEPEVPEEEVGARNPFPTGSEEEDDFSDLSSSANFTQNGHVTAARIEDMRKKGFIPPGYNPPAYKVRSARELLPAWMFEDDDDES